MNPVIQVKDVNGHEIRKYTV